MPLAALPISAAGMLLPDEVLAFAPAPVVWMNLDVHSRREGVVFVNVPAVPIRVADDPR